MHHFDNISYTCPLNHEQQKIIDTPPKPPKPHADTMALAPMTTSAVALDIFNSRPHAISHCTLRTSNCSIEVIDLTDLKSPLDQLRSKLAGSTAHPSIIELNSLVPIQESKKEPCENLASAIATLGKFSGNVIADRLETIRQSAAYERWHAFVSSLNNDPTMARLLACDTLLKYLVCPITHKIVSMPATVYGDSVYEYEAVVEWLKSQPNEPLPAHTIVYPLTQFIFDPVYINSIVERVLNLSSLLKIELHERLTANIRGMSQQALSTSPMGFGAIVPTSFSDEELHASLTPSQLISILFIRQVLDGCNQQLGNYRQDRQTCIADRTLSKHTFCLKTVGIQTYNRFETFLRDCFSVPSPILISNQRYPLDRSTDPS
jgi:hypothetical protein